MKILESGDGLHSVRLERMVSADSDELSGGVAEDCGDVGCGAVSPPAVRLFRVGLRQR